MSGLTVLDAQFADGNVPLGVIVGAIGALSAVRRLLPATTSRRAAEPQSPEIDPDDRFVALLLGVVVVHDRLTTLVDRSAAFVSTEASERESVTGLSLLGLGR